MKLAYPIVLTKSDDWFVVTIPDLQLNTQGKDIPDAIEMARDAIGMACCYLKDEKKELPEASEIGSIFADADDIITLVDIDLDAYRRKHDTKAVRKNLTIPAWLNEAAEQAGINFSQVLQEALKAQLNE